MLKEAIRLYSPMDCNEYALIYDDEDDSIAYILGLCGNNYRKEYDLESLADIPYDIDSLLGNSGEITQLPFEDIFVMLEEWDSIKNNKELGNLQRALKRSSQIFR